MKLARTNEQPPRLAVICDDIAEFNRLETAAKIYGISARQANRLQGGDTNTAVLSVRGLRRDMAQPVDVAFAEATGKERVFATDLNNGSILGDIAFDVVDEMTAEALESDLNKGLYGTEAVPRMSPYYHSQAIKYWQGIGEMCVQPIDSLPVVDMELSHPTPTHPTAN